MDTLSVILSIVVAVGAVGWVGTTLVSLVRSPSTNAKERAEATDVGVGSLLKIIDKLEARLIAVESENKKLREDNELLHDMIAELQASIRRNRRIDDPPPGKIDGTPI